MTLNAKFLYEQTVKNIGEIRQALEDESNGNLANKTAYILMIDTADMIEKNMTDLWEAMLETEKDKNHERT